MADAQPSRAPAGRSYPVILTLVKTAISMPDETFARATRLAAEQGISRSQLVTRAVQAYLDRRESESARSDIDQALAMVDDDQSAQAAVSAGRDRLARDDGDW